jgi:hypothetical protein
LDFADPARRCKIDPHAPQTQPRGHRSISDISDTIYARARGECELRTLAIGKLLENYRNDPESIVQERISATGWAW